MRQIYWMAAGLLLGTFSSCTGTQKESTPLLTVKVDSVQAAESETVLQYPGKVKAAQDISLSFRVSGTIDRFFVDDGTPVRQGQLLVQLDPTDYRLQLEATEAEYRQVKADAERVMALYADSATSASLYDKATYGLQQMTAKYQHHRDQLAYTQLHAPFDGIVQKRLFEAHETVGAGMPVLSMIGSGRPEVEINLPAAEYIHRERFRRYYCTFDLYPGHRYLLKPVSITPKANANQLYTMRLQLEAEAGAPLPSPGMSTLVTIRSTREEGAQLSVPTSALWQEEGETRLFRYDPATQTVHACRVEVGRPLSDGRILVTSDTLKEGDCVVSSGARLLKEGARVKPLEKPSPTNVGGLL